jgi:hypothetical protein
MQLALSDVCASTVTNNPSFGSLYGQIYTSQYHYRLLKKSFSGIATDFVEFSTLHSNKPLWVIPKLNS